MAVDGVKGYLPPEGPRHGVPYRWIEGQGVHKIGNAVVDSPEALILTANQTAQRNCERSDLEAVTDEVVEKSLEAILEDEDDRVAEIVADYRAGNEDLAAPAEDRPEIPEDLSDVEYRADDEPDLQDYAQAHGIAANQSGDEIREQLAELRDQEASG
ncbi:hypothetical protein [Halococcus saccharolyticus]|uniref:hypothetical protein n=1 Tax=Halococcus saccharolyticus TaxID=62319 RepID=UPI0040403710